MRSDLKILVAAAVLQFAAVGSAISAEKLIDYVNPMIATGGDGFGVGSGYPGPTAPYGMIKPGPDTTRMSGHPGYYHCAGYYYGDTHIRTFSHTRAYATGVEVYGYIGLMPTLGDPAAMTEEKNYKSRFDHANEEAKPGYYRVKLDDTGVIAELTAGERTAMHRYSFPQKEEGLVVLNASHFIQGGRPVAAEVEVLPERNAAQGWFHHDGPMAGRIKIYFAVRSERPFSGYGAWADGTYEEGARKKTGETAGAVLRYAEPGGRPLLLKVAISYISVEQAWKNLEAEAPGDDFDFDALRAKTAAKWEALLSRVRVKGGSPKMRRIFYTALYHTLVMPTLWTEEGDVYLGLDEQVHKAEGFRYYTDFSLWDTYRTFHPWIALAYPEYAKDMAESLVKMYEQDGQLPKWPAGANDSGSMIGDPAAIALADAYQMGVRGFDVETAYKAMREAATGELPNGLGFGTRGGEMRDYLDLGFMPADRAGGATSKNLEIAYADAALADLAGRLGKEDDRKKFELQSKNYKNLWDPKLQFMTARNADGSWVTGFQDDVWKNYYVEGTAWQWLWLVPYDVKGLIGLFGGAEPFYAKLNALFEKSHAAPDTMLPDNYYWHGNEPDIHAAYLFHWAGRPDRTAEEVRWIMRSKYDDSHDGLDGNDDGGALSAWYLFSSIGFFPFAGTGSFVVGSPIFEEARIALPNGREAVVRAPGVSPKSLYVKSATLNGRPLERPMFDYSELSGGGELVLEMSETPESWGTAIP